MTSRPKDDAAREQARKDAEERAEFERQKWQAVREWEQACDPNFVPPPHKWPSET